MSARRNGLPYIHVTWLAKLLGGNKCVWAAWFKSRHTYEKFEEMASDLAEWNRQHTALMARRRRELEAEGWAVTVEEENAFKLKGHVAIVAGKADLVAQKPGHVLVVDGKTGRVRDADVWQVLLYLYALPKSRPDLAGVLEGEIFYKSGEVFNFTSAELTPERMNEIVQLIRAIASDEPPARVPSEHECRRCNIGPRDCPQRVRANADAVAVAEF